MIVWCIVMSLSCTFGTRCLRVFFCILSPFRPIRCFYRVLVCLLFCVSSLVSIVTIGPHTSSMSTCFSGCQAHYRIKRRSRQRECLNVSGLSICLSVCLFSRQNAYKNAIFFQKPSNLELWSLLTTYRKSHTWAFQRTHY